MAHMFALGLLLAGLLVVPAAALAHQPAGPSVLAVPHRGPSVLGIPRGDRPSVLGVPPRQADSPVFVVPPRPSPHGQPHPPPHPVWRDAQWRWNGWQWELVPGHWAR